MGREWTVSCEKEDMFSDFVICLRVFNLLNQFVNCTSCKAIFSLVYPAGHFILYSYSLFFSQEIGNLIGVSNPFVDAAFASSSASSFFQCLASALIHAMKHLCGTSIIVCFIWCAIILFSA